jgi:hypothetical protein
LALSTARWLSALCTALAPIKGDSPRGFMRTSFFARSVCFVNVVVAATAVPSWHPHCANNVSKNTSLGRYINKYEVKAFVRERTPNLRIAGLVWHSYNSTAQSETHYNYTAALESTRDGKIILFLKATHLTGGVVKLKDGRFYCLKEPCGGPKNEEHRQHLLRKWKGNLDAANMQFACDRWMNFWVHGRTNQKIMMGAVAPGCLIEEGMRLTGPNGDDIKVTPMDIKIFCMNGRPMIIMVCSHRFDSKFGTHNTYFTAPSFEPLNISEPAFPHAQDYTLKKPVYLDRILESAANLSKGFSSVRVDFLYFSDDSERGFAFGELTFTHHACQGSHTFLPTTLEDLYGEVISGQHTEVSDLEMEAKQLEYSKQWGQSNKWLCNEESRLCGWDCKGHADCNPGIQPKWLPKAPRKG